MHAGAGDGAPLPGRRGPPRRTSAPPLVVVEENLRLLGAAAERGARSSLMKSRSCSGVTDIEFQ